MFVSVCEVAPEQQLCAVSACRCLLRPIKSTEFSCMHETIQDIPGHAGNLAADANTMELGARGPCGPSVDRPVDRSVDRCIFLGFLPWTVNLF